MREMLKPSPAPSRAPGHWDVLLLTDGRFSGGTTGLQWATSPRRRWTAGRSPSCVTATGSGWTWPTGRWTSSSARRSSTRARRVSPARAALHPRCAGQVPQARRLGVSPAAPSATEREIPGPVEERASSTDPGTLFGNPAPIDPGGGLGAWRRCCPNRRRRWPRHLFAVTARPARRRGRSRVRSAGIRGLDSRGLDGRRRCGSARCGRLRCGDSRSIVGRWRCDRGSRRLRLPSRRALRPCGTTGHPGIPGFSGLPVPSQPSTLAIC